MGAYCALLLKCAPSIFRSQTTLTVNFSGHRTWCEALLAELFVSVRSNSRRKRAFQSLSYDLFSEKIPYIQLNAKLKDMASYIVLGSGMPYLFKTYSDSNNYLSEADFIEILKILIGNIVVINAPAW
jgi:hypothetical protein